MDAKLTDTRTRKTEWQRGFGEWIGARVRRRR
jgi:hypothetical protein